MTPEYSASSTSLHATASSRQCPDYVQAVTLRGLGLVNGSNGVLMMLQLDSLTSVIFRIFIEICISCLKLTILTDTRQLLLCKKKR